MRGRLFGRVVGLVLLGAVLLPPAAPARAAPMLQVSATDSPGVFEFIATGFGAIETISTWLTGPSQQVQATPSRKADDAGEILFRLRLPRYFEPGRWALTAHGLRTDLEAVVYFDLPVRGADVAMDVTPAGGPPGTVFSFSASGFRAGERVSSWLTGPDGAAVDGEVVEASPTGRIRLRHRTTADTAAGRWTLTAYGTKSDRLAMATFSVG